MRTMMVLFVAGKPMCRALFDPTLYLRWREDHPQDMILVYNDCHAIDNDVKKL